MFRFLAPRARETQPYMTVLLALILLALALLAGGTLAGVLPACAILGLAGLLWRQPAGPPTLRPLWWSAWSSWAGSSSRLCLCPPASPDRDGTLPSLSHKRRQPLATSGTGGAVRNGRPNGLGDFSWRDGRGCRPRARGAADGTGLGGRGDSVGATNRAPADPQLGRHHALHFPPLRLLGGFLAGSGTPGTPASAAAGVGGAWRGRRRRPGDRGATGPATSKAVWWVFPVEHGRPMGRSSTGTTSRRSARCWRRQHWLWRCQRGDTRAGRPRCHECLAGRRGGAEEGQPRCSSPWRSAPSLPPPSCRSHAGGCWLSWSAWPPCHSPPQAASAHRLGGGLWSDRGHLCLGVLAVARCARPGQYSAGRHRHRERSLPDTDVA